MGAASSSMGDRVLRAAKLNDVAELQMMLLDMRRNAALDADTRRRWVDTRDAETGRTPLIVCAQRNFLAAAQVLLDDGGADVRAVASAKRPAGGTALAEAVLGRHEAMVELLLSRGADPFTEGPDGRAPLDLALDARAASVLRRFEAAGALFAGSVAMRTPQLKGLASANKDRYVVVAPRFTPPGGGVVGGGVGGAAGVGGAGGGVGTVRVMLLSFRSAAEAEPRTRVWLDGATLFRAGEAAALRLHANHEQPRAAFTRYDHGWLLFFSPARGGDAAANAATFAAFLAVAHRPLEQLQQQQQLRAAGGGGAAWASHQQQQQQQSTGALAANPWQAAAAAGAPLLGQPTPAPTAAAQQQQQQQQQQRPQQIAYGGYGSARPAAAPPSVAQRPPSQPPPAPFEPTLGLQAAPGEDDEAFARRLAALYGGGNDGSPGSSPSRRTPGSSSAVAGGGRANSTGALPAVVTTTTTTAAAATDMGRASSASAASSPSANPFAAHSPLTSSRPALAAHQQQQQQQQVLSPLAQPSAAPAAAAAPPPPPPPVASAPPLAAAAAAASAAQAGRTGGAAAGAGSNADGEDDDDDDDDDLCVICMSAPREAGFLHGSSVHKAACRGCAGLIAVGAACPICRATVERVIGVF